MVTRRYPTVAMRRSGRKQAQSNGGRLARMWARRYAGRLPTIQSGWDHGVRQFETGSEPTQSREFEPDSRSSTAQIRASYLLPKEYGSPVTSAVGLDKLIIAQYGDSGIPVPAARLLAKHRREDQ